MQPPIGATSSESGAQDQYDTLAKTPAKPKRPRRPRKDRR